MKRALVLAGLFMSPLHADQALIELDGRFEDWQGRGFVYNRQKIGIVYTVKGEIMMVVLQLIYTVLV